jgi:hypothetical protein
MALTATKDISYLYMVIYSAAIYAGKATGTAGDQTMKTF